jgi:hypothetical protein
VDGAFCLRCRTLLRDIATCDVCGTEHVISLSTQDGLELLRRNVWFEAPWSGKTLKIVATLLALAGGLITAIAVALPFAIGPMGVIGIVLATIVTIVVVGLIGGQIPFRVRPRGTSLHPSLSEAPLVGRIVASSRQGREVASALELDIVEPNDEVTLRAASSHGFELVLDDGRRVEIPPGRVRIAMDGAETLHDYDGLLADLGLPGANRLREWLPHHEARRVTLSEGDRVELSAELEPARDERVDYRSEVRLRASGVARLRKL